MINDLSNSLADRMVNLSPEVRAFCEENSRKIAGEPPRFQTMSDAWVFAVLEGMKTQTKFEGELKKTKDAFRWRLVNSDFRGILLLAVIQELEGGVVEDSNGLIEVLERFAHSGVMILSKHE